MISARDIVDALLQERKSPVNLSDVEKKAVAQAAGKDGYRDAVQRFGISSGTVNKCVSQFRSDYDAAGGGLFYSDEDQRHIASDAGKMGYNAVAKRGVSSETIKRFRDKFKSDYDAAGGGIKHYEGKSRNAAERAVRFAIQAGKLAGRPLDFDPSELVPFSTDEQAHIACRAAVQATYLVSGQSSLIYFERALEAWENNPETATVHALADAHNEAKAEFRGSRRDHDSTEDSTETMIHQFALSAVEQAVEAVRWANAQEGGHLAPAEETPFAYSGGGSNQVEPLTADNFYEAPEVKGLPDGILGTYKGVRLDPWRVVVVNSRGIEEEYQAPGAELLAIVKQRQTDPHKRLTCYASNGQLMAR